MAQRFLVMKQLLDSGLVTPVEALPRIETNKGAILPLTTPFPPAIDLDRPVPSAGSLVGRLRELSSDTGRGSPANRADEHVFLLDGILPAEPTARQPLMPPDMIAARKLLPRLNVLRDVGLISEAERDKEVRAVQSLIASGKLPETEYTPPPPPPPPHKVVKKRSRRNFGTEFAPNPPGVAPPKLESKAKSKAGVQLLSMASATHGEKAWAALQKEFPELAQLTYKAVKADLGDLGVTYRLIAGPLDADSAERLCTELRAKSQSCSPTPFPE